ncbi:MAG: sulfite exporter TauE/SafE family protein, partial [Gemmatimonadales bacterium]|nr:sulfite exporter TauE/SafE family protein [Gemmatimonadales bacterium]
AVVSLTFRGSPHPHSRESARMVVTFLLIGLAAGVLSGLFGVGGGILIIPALVLLANFPAKLALGTSLGALLLPVGLLGAYAYWRQGYVDAHASLLLAAGLFFGTYAGARLAQGIHGATLQRMLAVFIVAMAVQIWVEAGGK